MPLALLVAADILVQLPKSLRYGLVASQALWILGLFMILPTTGRGHAAPRVADLQGQEPHPGDRDQERGPARPSGHPGRGF